MDDTLYVTDSLSNVIAKIDANGVHTTNLNLSGGDIMDNDSDSFTIVDVDGNKILTVDNEGVHTTALFLHSTTAEAEAFAMPVIRMGPTHITKPTEVLSKDNPVKFSVKATEGMFQIGDQLQLCERKKVDGKFKLVSFANYTLTEEDLDKEYITITVTGGQELKKLLSTGSKTGGKDGAKDYFTNYHPKFLRIRRTKTSGDKTQVLFSNELSFYAFGRFVALKNAQGVKTGEYRSAGTVTIK